MRVTCGLILVLVLAGCGSVAPSARPSPTTEPSAASTTSPQPAETRAATPTPSATTSPSAKPEITDLVVEVHRVPAEFTGHIAAFLSLGDELVWSGGPGNDDNDLYRYVPGAASPELLFANPLADSHLTSLAGSAAGYVFTDERWLGDELRGWQLWFLSAAGAEPVLVDQSTDDRLIAPTIAMDDHWIAWEVVHGTYEDRVNELRVASVDEPQVPMILLSYPGHDVYMQFPSLWADELWYGIADNDWEAMTEAPRVEMIDLTTQGKPPAVFGAERRGFMPDAGQDVVAWRSGGTPELAALNSGALTLFWRATGQTEELPVPGPAIAADRISYPSVGNRFVAWWDDIQQRQYVYDLAEGQFRRIAEYDWTGEERVVKTSLAGDLLVYTHYLSEGERYLEWCVLPE